jgi:hypothetical protein
LAVQAALSLLDQIGQGNSPQTQSTQRKDQNGGIGKRTCAP